MVRVLKTGDEGALERFLSLHADTSMFLRSNARAGGLDDRGEPLQATYAAAFIGDSISAVSAHCWNGMLLVQAPERLDEVVRVATRASGRRIAGISGPWEQTQAAARFLRVNSLRDEVEVLYALDLHRLRLPALLEQGGLRVRRPRLDELDALCAWRREYLVETGLARLGPDLAGLARAGISLSHALGLDWVLEEGARTVAYSCFNAALPEIVQVGGVYAPRHLRGRGFGRAVVAGSLQDARQRGVRRAVLFTQENNAAARTAYEALGFERAGAFGLWAP